MSIRLNKALRELNIGLQTAVEFLSKRSDLGEVEAEPSFKLSDQQYKALTDAFSQDKKVRDQAEKLFTKKTKDKKRVPEQKEDREENAEVSNGKQQFKPLGKIDLDSIGKPTAKSAAPENRKASGKESAAVSSAPVTNASKAEVKASHEHQKGNAGGQMSHQHKQNGERNNGQQKQNNHKSMQNQANNNQPQQGEKPAETNASGSVFTLKSEKKFSANEPKVLGKIDLSSLNQSTRPKKKSKEERRKEREEKLAQQHSERKKRVRINKERVDINAEANQGNNGGNKNNGGNQNNQNGGNKKKKNKNRNNNNKGGNQNNQRQIEVDDEAVARQVKETLARLTSKSQNKKGAKYRKEKREAVQEKLQDQARQEQKESKILKLTEFVTVSELATMMDISVTQVISTLMGVGIMVSINQRLDAETINMVAEEFGFKTEYVSAEVQEAVSEEEDDENDLVPRAPIVTVMGHVDHGKTSLLDYIRNTNVIAGEAGGITQHIGAYSVTLKSGRKVTFLDTPGHEAFTAMRARGAQATDIAIIIIAADDSVMPTTKEAIAHAQAAGVPMVFAINKIDKPGANPERVIGELAEHGIISTAWGGDCEFVEISAKFGKNIDELLETVLLVAEMEELKADPTVRAIGTVIEARLDKGKGPVATLLVQQGTLHVQDPIVVGNTFGRVRAMVNDLGRRVKVAEPSTPVSITGLNDVPMAGDHFAVYEDEKAARAAGEERAKRALMKQRQVTQRVSLENLFDTLKAGEVKTVNVIIKADVQGSVEALAASLLKIDVEGVKVSVVHSAVGAINESDVTLAEASKAFIIGFNVRPTPQARQQAETDEVEIRLHSIIYKVIEEVEDAMKGMLDPEYKEKIIGEAIIRETFKVSKVGTIGGFMVTSGKITRDANARVIRDGVVIFDGKLASLKHFKDDVKEIGNGQEGGLRIENYNDIKVDDVIEAYVMEEIKR